MNAHPRPQSLPKHRHPSPRQSFGLVLAAGLTASLQMPLGAQTVWTEGFNTDGDPSRYTTTGSGVSEVADHAANGVPTDQAGPVYWARNTDVSFVGVPAPTAERRALLAWDAAIQETDVTAQFWTMFDAAIDWLLRGQAGATIVFSPDSIGPASLAARLTSKGHTVLDDDGVTPENQVVADLVIKGLGGNPSRFGTAAIPLLTYSSQDHDDLLVSTIGRTSTFEPGDATIVTSTHPAAGGLTGSFPVITTPGTTFTWQLMGDQLPIGAITIAEFTEQIPATVAGFQDVDDMVAGIKQSASATSTDTVLDYSDGSAAVFFNDLPLPGGVANVWGLVLEGRISVSTAGTYSFAVVADDGVRLRIDVNGNGFDNSDNVAVQTGVGTAYGDVALTAGVFDFEVTAYNSGGPGHVEVAVSLTPGGGANNISDGSFQELGLTTGAVGLQGGSFTATSFTPTGPADERTVPLLVLLNGPNDTPAGSVFGGGPFNGFEGTGFYGGSGLNKFDFDGSGTTKTMQFPPINVTGRQNLRLTVDCAATYLDFETSDFLDFLIDPNNTGSFTRLIHFTAPSGNDKFFDDRTTNPGNPARLGLTFREVSYSIPPGATQLVLRIESLTSWWNEIVAFDNIRITEGTTVPNLQLEGSATVNGTYSGEPAAVINVGAKTITLPVPSSTRFFRAAGSAVTLGPITFQGANLVINYQ